LIQISPLLALLAVLNAFSLALFGVDKLISMRGGRRISEAALLLVAFCGPIGAFAGMLLFRHKTHKIKFLLVPSFIFIQLGVIFYLQLWFF
jgi:uncharacterized membrane protein YsdA (DUF1294 family)